MENRGFKPSIQRHPDRAPRPVQLDEDLEMKSGDEVGEPIWDISHIDKAPVPANEDEDVNDDEEDDDNDEREPDYDRDIKPYHKIPVQDDGFAEPPTPVDEIPYDEDQERAWKRSRQDPNDPDSVPRGVWNIDKDK